jgi:hypothetical protein
VCGCVGVCVCVCVCVNVCVIIIALMCVCLSVISCVREYHLVQCRDLQRVSTPHMQDRPRKCERVTVMM